MSARIDTPQKLLAAYGPGRPVLNVPSPQWAIGPFGLDAAVADGAATAVDLTTQDAWFGDPAMRAAYGLSDGSTTKMQATVHVEAVELLFTQGSFAALAAATKDNVTGLYIEATVAGTTIKIPLFRAMSQLIEENGTTVAATTPNVLRGGPRKLPSPIRVNLEQDQFLLKSDADIALGAAQDTKLFLHGIILPKSADVDGAISGASSCGAGVASDPGEGYNLNSIRTANMQVSALYPL